MIGKTDDLTILKTLTSTLNDSIKGYRDVGRKGRIARNSANCSTDFAEQREQASADLKAEVRRLGGDPDDDGSMLGSLHQAWLDLKAAITGRDDKAIINEVERGEDYLKEKFETALKTTTSAPTAARSIERAYQSVREGHDRMSQHQARASKPERL